MSALVVDAMRREDIEPIRQIELKSFDSTWPEDAFVNELENNGAARYLVARLDGRVVGYAGAWMILDEMHVTAVAVDPEVRGQRLGKKLFWHLMKAAVDHGSRWATLEVRETNEVAVGIYREFGYSRVGVRRKYYEGKDDALVMWVGDLQTPGYQEKLAEIKARWEAAEVTS